MCVTDWTGDMDGVMGYIEKQLAEQRQMMAEISAAVCRQNSELRDAYNQRQTSCMSTLHYCAVTPQGGGEI